jgi:hypothetical protein
MRESIAWHNASTADWEFSPEVKYNTEPGREGHSTGLVQRIHIVETDSTR